MPNVSTPLEAAPALGDFQPAGADQLAGGFMNRVSHLGQSMVGAVQSGFDRVGEALGDVRMPTLSRGSVARLAGLTLIGSAAGAAIEMANPEDAQAGSRKAHITRVKSVVPGHSSMIDEAQEKFDNDPRRAQPWGGNDYPTNNFHYRMFVLCTPGNTDAPADAVPRIKKGGGLSVSFSSGPVKYCDLMGKTTERIQVFVKGPRKTSQIGQTVIYENGMRENLARYLPGNETYQGNAANRMFRKTVTIPGIGNLCRRGADGKPPEKDVIVKIKRYFKGNPRQTFQKAEYAGRTGHTQTFNDQHTFVTEPKNVCK